MKERRISKANIKQNKGKQSKIERKPTKTKVVYMCTYFWQLYYHIIVLQPKGMEEAEEITLRWMNVHSSVVRSSAMFLLSHRPLTGKRKNRKIRQAGNKIQ